MTLWDGASMPSRCAISACTMTPPPAPSIGRFANQSSCCQCSAFIIGSLDGLPRRLPDSWLYKSVQTIDLDRLFAARQSQGVVFALPIPQPGEMPSYVFPGQAKTRYPAIWSVSADIECNGLIVSAGSVFLGRGGMRPMRAATMYAARQTAT